MAEVMVALIVFIVAVVGLALYLLFRPSGVGFAYLSPAIGTGTSKEDN